MGSQSTSTATATDRRDGAPLGRLDDDPRNLVGRIAAILDAFDDDAKALSLAELGRRAALPKSTVHRLAEQLRTLGWLEREPRGYRVGLRLFELGGLAVSGNNLRATSSPHVNALCAQTGLAVHLGVLDLGEVVIIDRAVSNESRMPTRLGGRIPAYCTAIGKAMVAYDPTATEHVLDHPLARRTNSTLSSAERLRGELEQIRRHGVAHDREEAFDGLACVAAPIRNSGRAIGAVSVTGSIAELDPERVAPLVQRTASHIWNSRFARDRSA